MKTLTEVLRCRAEIETAVQKQADVFAFCARTLFDSVRMDGVVVWNDLIAKRYLEVNYLVNTHVAPERLPGVGISVSDIICQEGKSYITVDLNVIAANVFALHLIRPYETIYAEWAGCRDEVNTRLRAFIGKVQLQCSSQCFGLLELKTFTRTTSAVGFDDVGTPTPELVDSLFECSRLLERRRKRGMHKLAHEAYALAGALQPYSVFQGVMGKIRKRALHKSFPRIRNGMFQFNSPAASGGATLHTHGPSDDVLDAVPSGNDLFLVAAQAGNIPVTHIGAGTLKGEHFFMLIPRTPFFLRIQKKIDESEAINRRWKECVSADSFETIKEAAEWTKETAAVKWEVIKETVPEVVRTSVLGLHVDMNEERGVALIRPVVAESHLGEHRAAVKSSGLSVFPLQFAGLLGEGGDSYIRMRSVF